MAVRNAVIAVGIAATLFALTGCTSQSLSHSRAVVSAAGSRSSASTDAPVTPRATPTPNPSVGMIGAFQIEIPVDSGSRQFATGKVTTDRNGVPSSYTVASGDVIDYVAARFGFFDPSSGEGFNYLNTINQVRRGTYPNAPDGNFALFAGDILNLSAYTMGSVGSENGHVIPGPMPSPAPAQR
jgi:hypothetical protein